MAKKKGFGSHGNNSSIVSNFDLLTNRSEKKLSETGDEYIEDKDYRKELNETMMLFDKFKPKNNPTNAKEKQQVKKIAELLLNLANLSDKELSPLYLEYLSNIILRVPLVDVPLPARFAIWAGLMNNLLKP